MTIVPALMLPYFVWKHQRVDRAGLRPAESIAGGGRGEAEREGASGASGCGGGGVGPEVPEGGSEGEVAGQGGVSRPFFSIPALAVLAAAYVALPVTLSNWSYLHCRLVPFLWVGLALRLPSTLPRPIAVVLAACALSFSTVMGIDYARLDRDRAEFTAGMDAVPARATLLPLLFEKSKTSDFTASLTHAWGYYTVAKNTSAPLVYAMERSYPIIYRDFPPALRLSNRPSTDSPSYTLPRRRCAKSSASSPSSRHAQRPGANCGIPSGSKQSPVSVTCSPGPFHPRHGP